MYTLQSRVSDLFLIWETMQTLFVANHVKISALNNSYFIIGKQLFLCLDDFNVHENTGHPSLQVTRF